MLKAARWLAAAFCLGLAAPAPAQAQETWDGEISVEGGHYFAPIFNIIHTDPRTRLTSIRIDGLPERVAFGVTPIGYSFSFLHPEPWYIDYEWEVVGTGFWSGDDGDGYRPETFGWEVNDDGFTHRRGFRGNVFLPVFDMASFFGPPLDFADLDPPPGFDFGPEFDWNLALAHANVTATTVTPEPSTLVLLGSALAMVGLVAWRRRGETNWTD